MSRRNAAEYDDIKHCCICSLSKSLLAVKRNVIYVKKEVLVPLNIKPGHHSRTMSRLGGSICLQFWRKLHENDLRRTA